MKAKSPNEEDRRSPGGPRFYLPSGYLNFGKIMSIPVPFVFIYGPRGVGKTYGALQFVKEQGIKFMYSRRQQVDLDMIQKPDTFPFKKLNSNRNWTVTIKPLNKYMSAFYDGEDIDGRILPSGPPIGYASALSTIANVRGMDCSDVDVWIYDEFIPEAHARPIREEGAAFLNAYETFNRNRELEGDKPMKVICLANSNRLANPIFMELGLVTVAERMKRKGLSYYCDETRGIALLDTYDSPISAQKEETALYRLANQDSVFYRMAIENRFADLDETEQTSRNLKEYTPVFIIGELCIYKHKTRRVYYVTDHKSGSPPSFLPSEMDVHRCLNKFPWVLHAYMENKIEFESYLCEALFNKYFY